MTFDGRLLGGVGVLAAIAESGSFARVEELIDQGKLVDLFPSWSGEKFPLFALYPSRHLPAAKVRAFIEFVADAIGAPSSKRAARG